MRLGPLSMLKFMCLQATPVFVLLWTELTFEPLVEALLFMLLLDMSDKICFEAECHEAELTEEVPFRCVGCHVSLKVTRILEAF